MVRAVILAAGASSRMGRPKAALPLSDPADTYLLRIIRTCSAAGLPEIVVVTGAAADATRRAAGPQDSRVRFVHNPAWESGQLSSLLAGLQDRRGQPLEAAMVTLVDVPFVSADTMRRVIGQWRATRAPIVRPARGDEHGHPVVFDRSLFDALRGADPRTGAKPVVRAHAAAIVNVPVDDPGAFLDTDTEPDYHAAVAHLGARPNSARRKDSVSR